MCATCAAQGAAFLVPAYAAFRTQAWRRRRRADEHAGPGGAAADRGVEPVVPDGQPLRDRCPT